VRAWSAYAAASLGVVALVVAGAWLLAVSPAREAVVLAALAAYVLQLAAFAGLLAGRRHADLFIAGWAGGMLLRFAALAAFAFVLSRTGALPLEPALLTLVGVMFVLVLLEAFFLRWNPRAS
jgi:hypothetical protein